MHDKSEVDERVEGSWNGPWVRCQLLDDGAAAGLVGVPGRSLTGHAASLRMAAARAAAELAGDLVALTAHTCANYTHGERALHK